MRYLLLLALLLASATASFAQQLDYSNWEFYGGYAYERADNGASRLNRDATISSGNGAIAKVNFASQQIRFNGFSTELVANVTRHVGIVANFGGEFNNNVRYASGLGPFDARLRRWHYFVGPRFNFRNDSRLIPFGEAMVGVTRSQVRFRQNIFSSANTETAFSMALGGGLDIRAGKHIDLRAGQIDYIPTFFKNQRDDAFRISAGIKIKTAPVEDP
jgi:opacity protein-like surface antigen